MTAWRKADVQTRQQFIAWAKANMHEASRSTPATLTDYIDATGVPSTPPATFVTTTAASAPEVSDAVCPDELFALFYDAIAALEERLSEIAARAPGEPVGGRLEEKAGKGLSRGLKRWTTI